MNFSMESLQGNYISLLNEYQQKTQVSVEYEEGSTDGPSHNKTFTMRAIVDGQRYPEGTGKTKKEAKQNAAKNALNGIKSAYNTETTAPPVQKVSNDKTHPNYTCWLNEHAQKNKLILKAHESTKMDPSNSLQMCTYFCKYVCGDKDFPEACGKNKKEAKEAAAARVYEELQRARNSEVFDENSNRAQRSEDSSRSQDHSSFADNSRSSTPDHNYIAFLNEFCQKQKRVFDFKLVDRRGPPHNSVFVYKMVMDGKEYPEGQGKNSKEAKQNAAQQAWMELRDQQSWSTQSSEDDTASHSQETSESEDVKRSNVAPETPSSSESVLFRDPSAVSSPEVVSPVIPSASPLDVKSKIKLAPSFNLSPNGLARRKEAGLTMNINLLKPPGGQNSNHTTKSRFLEDFDSINPIGKGGFGRVFKARRKLEDKYFAVKIVKCKEKARREVEALADFNNANIVRYYTSWVEDTAYRHDTSESFSDSGSGPGTGFLYIQMEFCEGDTLRAWIEHRNSSSERFPERRTEAAHISRQVLKAIEYIHSKDRIHRDLKPMNIMFTSEGKVKVGDFGLVTAAEKDSEERLLERTQKTGTRSYMSPEQETQTSYDRKVDIYALGLIYFELIWNIITHHEKKKIWDDVRRRVFPPQFSETYTIEHQLIDRMLSLRPEDRPDATDLIRELDQSCSILKAQTDSRTY